MNTNNYDSTLAKCQEINQRVKAAEKHQAEYYRVDIAKLNYQPAFWKQVWASIQGLVARLPHLGLRERPAQSRLPDFKS